MVDIASCGCSLQERLHQVENARSREMEQHGEKVRQLEKEFDKCRASEAELRLTAAKLRAENCRLEAELCVSNMKARQLLEQLDECAKRSEDYKAMSEKKERLLQASCEKNKQIIDEKRQLNIEMCDCRTQFERAQHQSSLLLAEHEKRRVQIDTQATELTSKQQEVEMAALRSQLLLEDLSNAREKKKLMEVRVKELEHEINRMLVIQSRAFKWRRKRQDMWENHLLCKRTFLNWKSKFVQTELRKMAQNDKCARACLHKVKQELLKQAKEELSSIRQACLHERTRVQSLCDEICQTELPTLVVLLKNKQRDFDIQRNTLEAQLKTQRERADRIKECLEMSRQDVEHRVQKLTEAYQIQLTQQKRRQRAIYRLCTIKRHRESQRRTLNAWKDVYLRSVVGQATHAAMVLKSQISEVRSSKCCQELQTKATPAVVQSLPGTFELLQNTRVKVGDNQGSSVSGLATPIDTMWRKWRRIDAGGTRKGHKCPSSSRPPSQH